MFRLVLCVLLGLATFKLALAEPQQEKQTVTQLPIMINCVPNAVFDNMINEYGEQPFSQGNGTWSIPDGRDLSGKIITFVNPKTLTFTVAIDFVEVKCVVFSGNNFAPMFSEKNKT